MCCRCSYFDVNDMNRGAGAGLKISFYFLKL